MTKLTTTKGGNFVKIDKDGQLVLNVGNGVLVLPDPNGYKSHQAYDEAINVRAGPAIEGYRAYDEAIGMRARPAIERMHDRAEQIKLSIDNYDGDDEEWKEMCQQQHFVLTDLMGAMVDFVPLVSHWVHTSFNKDSNADEFRAKKSDGRILASLWRNIQSAFRRSFQLTIKGMRQLSMRNPTPESTAAIAAMEEWACNPLGFSAARTMQVVGQAIAAVDIIRVDIIRVEGAKRGGTDGVKKANYLVQMLTLMEVVVDELGNEAINVRAGPAIEKMHYLAEQIKLSIDNYDGDDEEWKEMCQQRTFAVNEEPDISNPTLEANVSSLATEESVRDPFGFSVTDNIVWDGAIMNLAGGLWSSVQSAFRSSLQLVVKVMSVHSSTPEATLHISAAQTIQMVGFVIAAVDTIREEAARRGDEKGVQMADYLIQSAFHNSLRLMIKEARNLSLSPAQGDRALVPANEKMHHLVNQLKLLIDNSGDGTAELQLSRQGVPDVQPPQKQDLAAIDWECYPCHQVNHHSKLKCVCCFTLKSESIKLASRLVPRPQATARNPTQ